MLSFFRNSRTVITPPLDAISVFNPETFASLDELDLCAERLATLPVVAKGETGPREFLALLNDEAERIESADGELSDSATAERLPVENWLHDNLHVMREQIWAVRRDLSRGYYQTLPKLDAPMFPGLPRVYALACELTARTGGRIDPEILRRFITAHQRIAPLTTGELWALPSMLRAALLRHMAHLTDEVLQRRRQRRVAQRFVGAFQRAIEHKVWDEFRGPHLPRTLTPSFVVQLVHDLRDLPPESGSLWQELEARLSARDTRLEDIGHQENTREAFLQLAVSNLVGSMRRLSAIDWQLFVERVSLVEETLRGEPGYADMDFETRDQYRRAVERLSRGSHQAELPIAAHAIALASTAPATDARARHVGYYLIGDGRRRLEAAIGYSPTPAEHLRRLVLKHSSAVYFTAMTLLSALTVAALAAYAIRQGGSWWMAAIAAAIALLPATELAVGLVHRIVTVTIQPHRLPKLDFSEGIPEEHRTLVVVPTLVTSLEAVDRQLQDLEVRSLANHGGAVLFGLVTDFADSPAENQSGDAALVARLVAGIELLNERHSGADRFVLFHRRRLWNPEEQLWMGWERKRGKLVELMRFLRTADRGSFTTIIGDEALLRASRYIVTLDADTQTPAGAVQQLAGAMAHPLNRPRLDRSQRRVVEGYGVIQPRVEIELESAEATPFARASSGGSGFDPYAHAVSDVYQDLFCEGNYVGKGILDIEAFEASLDTRIPENRLLSHDLFEGLYARTALCTDVHVVDDYPTHHLAWMARQHRWTRGDWQIASWLAPHVPYVSGTAPNVLPAFSRWKILDNLRRSLVPPAIVTFLVFAWTVAPGSPGVWMLFALLPLVLPSIFDVADAMMARLRGVSLRTYFAAQRARLTGLGLRLAMTIVFLAHQAVSLVDAIVRTLYRLCVSRHRLLEWESAAESAQRLRAERHDTYVVMWPAPVLALIVALIILATDASRLRWAFPVLAAWMASAELAYFTARPARHADEYLNAEDAGYLRRTALRCWTFFEDFVTADQHFLIPDNYQADRLPRVAARTSPTNIGLQLLADVAARDFGYASAVTVLERIERVVATLESLPRFRGHFYNWYDTVSLRPLGPEYISTVDSGNLAAHLLTVRQALVEMAESVPWLDPAFFDGLEDRAGVLRDLVQAEPMAPAEVRRDIGVLLERLAARPRTPSGWLWFLAELRERHTAIDAALAGSRDEVVRWSQSIGESLERKRAELEPLRPAFPWIERSLKSEPDGATLEDIRIPAAADLDAWVDVQRTRLLPDAPSEVSDALFRLADEGRQFVERVEELNERLLALVTAMDFEFLYDGRRGLFAIGFNVAENRLDGSYYDLLASEARLASLVAIATGEVPVRHWFKLGRRVVVPSAGSRALISWSASMFEYLMPALVTKLFPHTLLTETCKAVIDYQMEYAEERQVPWGFSESAYALRDRAGNYQYKAFGTPGLGLKPGLADELVVAPYATCLAAMLRPEAAAHNLRALQRLGLGSRYGFAEAIDYTTERVAGGPEVIDTYMAHHVGMSLAALDNAAHDNALQRRFHADSRIRAVEQLLQEQPPVPAPVGETPEATGWSRRSAQPRPPAVRTYATPHTIGPRAHLLSSGQYMVMLTNAGGGFSEVNGVRVTRWREDAARDCWGTFVYLKDPSSGRFWSATYQPTRVEPDDYDVAFDLARARFRRRDGEVESLLEIATGPEDLAEVRRLTLINHGARARDIELTTYAEITLTPALADAAHPAFSNLFVRTESLWPGALLAERRPRDGEGGLFAVHVLAGEGPQDEHETDRARFIGRGRDVESPRAMEDSTPLTGTTGPVLDPIFSLRRRVHLEPGARVSVAFATAFGRSHDEAVALAAKYREPSAIDRAFFLARSRTDVELHEFNLTQGQAMRFQRLASRIIHPDLRLRSAGAISRNRLPVRELWKHGVSGDLPIVLARVTEPSELDLVHELLAGHEYLRRLGYRFDLVILNEHGASYRQELQEQLQRLCLSGPWASYADTPGGTFLRSANGMSEEDCQLLQAAARVVCEGRFGSLDSHLRRLQRPVESPPLVEGSGKIEEARHERIEGRRLPPPAQPEGLRFWNGFGGFAEDGSYEIHCSGSWLPPAPWTNVLANPRFGCITTDRGLGMTWSENSQMHRLTPWSNDPIVDPPSEVIYIRDERDGGFWSATPAPRPRGGSYRVVHAPGTTTYHRQGDGVRSSLSVVVAAEDPVKLLTLEISHDDSASREFVVAFYAGAVLGERPSPPVPLVVTERDPETSAIFLQNAGPEAFSRRVAFVASSSGPESITGDRVEFLGRNGTLRDPDALQRAGLSGRVGGGMDPCAAMMIAVRVPPGESVKTVFLVGDAEDADEARRLVQRCASIDAAGSALTESRSAWEKMTGSLRVSTPEPALDLLMNGWLIWQTLSCRVWGRSSFYQSSGAFGFRDQLQDVLALVPADPSIARAHILKSASRQYEEGDVQHWWHEPLGEGVRTRCSDDLLWLAFATLEYIRMTGDTGVLDEAVPFLEGHTRPDKGDVFERPRATATTATLYEHCARTIDLSLQVGGHGLPLIGSSDWNDGYSHIGLEGRGESVWLGWFLAALLPHMALLADARGDRDRAARYRDHASTLTGALDRAWDGAWYRRAYFDDGTPLGSAANEEGRIDSIAQSWAVLSGAGDSLRARMAMDSVDRLLVDRRNGLIALLAPPFQHMSPGPGYIQAYPSGVRENGGQYTHAAAWVIAAFARLGESATASGLLRMANPVLRTTSSEDCQRYLLEPYYVAGDVYGAGAHAGRGGWSGYTGSSGWLYRVVLEEILGLRFEGAELVIAPRTPREWRNYQVVLTRPEGRLTIDVENRLPLDHDVQPTISVQLDGEPVADARLPILPGEHHVMVTVEPAARTVDVVVNPEVSA